MLTSFFGKSRPVNLVLAGAYLLLFYLLYNFSRLTGSSLSGFFLETTVFLILLLSLFVLNFISAKNELTGRNAYKIVLVLCFACMLPETLRNNQIVFSNFFVLLSLRRIVSLRSQRDSISKIFDAALWIGIASLFYFWSLLFLLLLYAGIVFHVGHRFKNFLIPLVSILVLFILATLVDLLITDTFFIFSDWYMKSHFDFEVYQNYEILLPAALLLTLFLWTGFFYVLMIQKVTSNLRTSYVLILLYAFLALVVSVLAPIKTSAELLFFLPPLALIGTNYFQVPRDRWFREILLMLLIILPWVIFFAF